MNREIECLGRVAQRKECCAEVISTAAIYKCQSKLRGR
jgi:hypothetical protein